MQGEKLRFDEDIQADINWLVRHYPPLLHDYGAIDIAVDDGKVTVKGHTKSSVTKFFLSQKLPDIAGVKSVNMAEFYDDAYLRRQIARILPTGVRVHVEYGGVALTGDLPEDVDGLVTKVAAINGVHKVAIV